MLDIKLIIEQPEKIKELLARKNKDFDPEIIIKLYSERKELLKIVEDNKATQNKLSSQVPSLKKEGKEVGHIFMQVKQLAQDNSQNETELKAIEEKINNELLQLPNIPDEDLLPGDKDNNRVVETHNKLPEFNYKIKDHVELCENLGLVDYKRAAKISGNGTWIYSGLGAQLEWALLNYFVATHISNSYKMILPPHILNYESGYVAGQFPKFEEDVFQLDGVSPKRFLAPTAETALVNLHRNEILLENELPKKYFAYTPCYRSEAGSYRSEERGMIRGYQFNKVEIVQYTTPEESDKAFDEMLQIAVKLVKDLGLHFQVSKLAAGDCSFAMARTYDIEVYIPSMGIYKEVSSVSNARDYQARRGLMRCKKDASDKARLMHTLNGSGLATSRLVPAIVEQFQQEDGSVLVPEVLIPFMNGVRVLK